MFEQMKIRYFILTGFLVLFGTLILLGSDLDHPVKEVVFTYIILGAFPMVWMGYYAEKLGYRMSDSVQKTGLASLLKPLGLIFLIFFLLSIGIVWVSSLGLSILFPDYVEFFLSDDELLPSGSPIAAFFLIIYISVIGPIVEEFMFRGLLLNRISYKLNVRYGIIISSFLFAILHFDIIGSFITGVVFSLLYLWTKNLLYPILLHIVNNSVALLLGLVPVPAFLSYETAAEIKSLAAALPNILLIIVCAPLLFYLMKKYKALFQKEAIDY